jgi:glutamate racemase
VRRFTLEATDWLLAQDVKLLVLACNTATARALDAVRERSTVPVGGVVRPGAVAAASATRSGTVGVIATAGTVESGAYPSAIVEAAPGTHVAQLACPELVPMVEAGILEGRRAESVLRAYLEPLVEGNPGIDTLLLGCTHYPLLLPVIAAVAGEGVAIVDSATATASALSELLAINGLEAPAEETGQPIHIQLTTGNVAAFRSVAGRLFGDAFIDVEPVELTAVAS